MAHLVAPRFDLDESGRVSYRYVFLAFRAALSISGDRTSSVGAESFSLPGRRVDIDDSRAVTDKNVDDN